MIPCQKRSEKKKFWWHSGMFVPGELVLCWSYFSNPFNQCELPCLGNRFFPWYVFAVGFFHARFIECQKIEHAFSYGQARIFIPKLELQAVNTTAVGRYSTGRSNTFNHCNLLFLYLWYHGVLLFWCIN